MYSKAIQEGYNILIEIAPSTKDLLFNIDFEELKSHGYRIVANILSACLENSLLSVHERYEAQLEAKMESPKLTDLKRAIDSYDALGLIIDELLKRKDIDINIFQRSPYLKFEESHVFIEPPMFITDKRKFLKKAYAEACALDKEDMMKYADERIAEVKSQMKKRKAPSDQRAQFKEIEELIKRNLKIKN